MCLPQFPYLSVGMHIPAYRTHVGTVKEGLSLGNLIEPMTAQCLKSCFLLSQNRGDTSRLPPCVSAVA